LWPLAFGLVVEHRGTATADVGRFEGAVQEVFERIRLARSAVGIFRPQRTQRAWRVGLVADAKIASHEETPEERRQRQEREADEFFGRESTPGVKKRKILG